MNTHQILLAVLFLSLLLITRLQRSRLLAPVLDFGVLLGLAVGITATTLLVHAA